MTANYCDPGGPPEAANSFVKSFREFTRVVTSTLSPTVFSTAGQGTSEPVQREGRVGLRRDARRKDKAGRTKETPSVKLQPRNSR